MCKLGSFIRTKRKEKGLSLRDLAGLCDLSHSYIDSLEKGKDPRTNKSVSPTIETIVKLSKGLNVPLQELTELAIEDVGTETNDNLNKPSSIEKDMPLEESLDTKIAANMESQYGEKPSPQLVDLIKKVLKDELNKLK